MARPNRSRPDQHKPAADRLSDQSVADLPTTIGPVVIGRLGRWVTVKSPREFNALMRRAGGLWDPGSRPWLIHQRRIGPVVRELRRATDPLFRRAGIDLDE
jgi:hypothetical protein